MKEKRQIVIELVNSYLRFRELIDNIEPFGIEFNRFMFANKLLDWAYDIIGFPMDTTINDDKTYNPEEFSRDWLRNSTLIDKYSSEPVHHTIEDYVDWLYQEYELYLAEGIDFRHRKFLS